MAQMVKSLPAMWETWVWSLGWDDPLEKEMATHSSILAWKIPWTEDPGRLQSMGSQRVGHNWATSLSFLGLKVKVKEHHQEESRQIKNVQLYKSPGLDSSKVDVVSQNKTEVKMGEIFQVNLQKNFTNLD